MTERFLRQFKSPPPILPHSRLRLLHGPSRSSRIPSALGQSVRLCSIDKKPGRSRDRAGFFVRAIDVPHRRRLLRRRVSQPVGLMLSSPELLRRPHPRDPDGDRPSLGRERQARRCKHLLFGTYQTRRPHRSDFRQASPVSQSIATQHAYPVTYATITTHAPEPQPYRRAAACPRATLPSARRSPVGEPRRTPRAPPPTAAFRIHAPPGRPR